MTKRQADEDIDTVVSIRIASANASRTSASLPCAAAGSGTPQWAVIGCPGQTTQPMKTCSMPARSPTYDLAPSADAMRRCSSGSDPNSAFFLSSEVPRAGPVVLGEGGERDYGIIFFHERHPGGLVHAGANGARRNQRGCSAERRSRGPRAYSPCRASGPIRRSRP
jgi:hypothetical protein